MSIIRITGNVAMGNMRALLKFLGWASVENAWGIEPKNWGEL